ncbi:hypothetical protein HN51_034896 [Arachis hypogaea]|uniref:Uncharacterized protein n=2 Tax=Arachis TaxID=3817 RepID=A0A445A6U3_ARAHY|nr:uncharacterized protein LOC107629694 isoform X1 [Arachis ipaensis]XP_025642989.1 uncharacterized protein LOC112737345 [Arachis hypogaea]QHN99785.1 uncharacterized protein DS421_13g400850 [Arachis hypogaea]RYR22167.1 hypothetical protein Ahy_B03g067444 [Arachis hypogaea]
MSVISRNIWPVCGSLCCFCPALRERSRHPIKRYKKLLADIFPKNQDEEPNDRMISKLCEYAAKNPLRVPKITSYLEQRCYRELRNENYHAVKVVICIYRKLLVSCRDQMPLFASSLLSIIQILLDQTRHDEVQILGCHTLFDFVNNQTDGTYMFNLDGFISKLCRLAQEMGEDAKIQNLRAAGIQVLSSMVWFMGEFSHISVEFDNVVSVVLENYGEVQKDAQRNAARLYSWKMIVNEKGELQVSKEDTANPGFWSRVCIQNMAKLAKEGTTVRRVLESLFRYFDNSNLWSPDHGLALSVLLDMQSIIENSGQNTHLLLSILVKHLDHKNVLKNPNMQLDIVGVISCVAQHTRSQQSVAIIGALSDMMRHLRKSIHCSLDDSSLGAEVIQWNQKYRQEVDECLVQLTTKIADAGPVLDTMAVMLENMSSITVMSRTLISAVYRTAQIVASIPNLTYQNKAFPEALFHQLLLSMVHLDQETRVGAHRIFSVVLVPSSVCPQPQHSADIQRVLSRNTSVFSSSAALFEKLERKPATIQEESHSDGNTGDNSIFNRLKSTYSRTASRRSSSIESLERKNSKGSSSIINRLKSSRSGSVRRTQPEENNTTDSSNKQLALPLRLSSHQITLMLSSIWAQSVYPMNTPENFEAIAHTFSLVLLVAQSKNSSYEALTESFQLAISLRSISLNDKVKLQPSRRRSLFTLATSMIVFTSKAYNIGSLISIAKMPLTDKTCDPFLQLLNDSKLQVVLDTARHSSRVYGSKEDDAAALKSLSAIKLTESQSKESFATMIVQGLGIPIDESSTLKEELLREFSPDDACPLGAQLSTETTEIYQAGLKDDKHSDMVDIPLFTMDDDIPSNGMEIQVHPNAQQPLGNTNLLSVDDILGSVLDTTNHVGRISTSTAPDMSYKEMALHCENLLMGKQEKLNVFMASNTLQSSFRFAPPMYNHEDWDKGTSANSNLQMTSMSGNPFLDPPNMGPNSLNTFPDSAPRHCGTAYQHQPNFFQLPAARPYDNFLKAAGC